MKRSRLEIVRSIPAKSAKPSRVNSQKKRLRSVEELDIDLDLDCQPSQLHYKPSVTKTSIEPKTPNQKRYVNAINTSALTFATGPSGVGKTWIAASMAAKALEENRVEKIILTRPAVEAGESLGFLPGELEEKFDPYLWPFRDVLEQYFGKTKFEYLLKMGTIDTKPLAYMRGMTFRDAFVILDEAQNASPTQMQMFLTRIGKGSTVVINGDLNQKDIYGTSGLEDAINKLSGIPEIELVEFEISDIVRSDLVGKIVRAYNK